MFIFFQKRKADPITTLINTLAKEIMKRDNNQQTSQEIKATINKDGIVDVINFGANKVANDFDLNSSQESDIASAETDVIKYVRKGMNDINSKGADLDGKY
ncbi:hypothetical protein CEXT_692351 [Caerostris extrusa]|uniref:Uncharacterized protein n=1 Tax=Caerostris extrusa TaxID=172846 RepID=A0AAV4XYC6_CAEEX|nr:hypothetical protein CEXT_692351 [Caerostris extrusa]